MAGKDPHTPPTPNNAARLQTLYEESLSAFEAERTTLPRGEQMKRLTELMRMATALAGVARAEHQTRAAAVRAERVFQRAGHDLNHDTPNHVEGDEMDMNGRSRRGRTDEEVEQLRGDLERRFGELAEQLEQKGMLERVIAQCGRGRGGLLAEPLELEPGAA